MTPFRNVQPGGQLDAHELNRERTAVEQQARLTVEEPLELVMDAAGRRIRLNLRLGRLGKITGSGADPHGGPKTAYSWIPVLDDGKGQFANSIPTDIGTLNAFFLGDGSAEVDDIVWLIPAPASPTWLIIGAGSCFDLPVQYCNLDGTISSTMVHFCGTSTPAPPETTVTTQPSNTLDRITGTELVAGDGLLTNQLDDGSLSGSPAVPRLKLLWAVDAAEGLLKNAGGAGATTPQTIGWTGEGALSQAYRTTAPATPGAGYGGFSFFSGSLAGAQWIFPDATTVELRADPSGSNGALVTALDARQFGCVCDGTTDDTTAFQAMLDAVPAQGGCCFLPAACTIKLQPDTIVISKPNTVLKADGSRQFITETLPSTYLDFASGDGYGIDVQHQGFVMEGIGLRRANNPSSETAIIHDSNAGKYKRVHFTTDQGGTAYLSNLNGWQGAGAFAIIEQCYFDGLNYGLKGLDDSNEITIRNNYFVTNRIGCYVKSGAPVCILGNDFEGNFEGNLHAYSGQKWLIDGNYMEQNPYGNELSVSDGFSGTDTTSISGRTPDTENPGHVWSAPALFNATGSGPDIVISGNAMICTGTGTTIAQSHVDSGQRDCKVSVDVVSAMSGSTGGTGLVFRVVDDNNYYALDLVTTPINLLRLFKVVAGTATVVASVALTVATNTLFTNVRAVLSGNSIYCAAGAGPSEISYTDADYKDETRHGILLINNTAPSADNFKVSGKTSWNIKLGDDSDPAWYPRNVTIENSFLQSNGVFGIPAIINNKVDGLHISRNQFSNCASVAIVSNIYASALGKITFQGNNSDVAPQTWIDDYTGVFYYDFDGFPHYPLGYLELDCTSLLATPGPVQASRSSTVLFTSGSWSGVKRPPAAVVVTNTFGDSGSGGYEAGYVWEMATKLGEVKTAWVCWSTGTGNWTDATQSTQISDLVFGVKDSLGGTPDNIIIRLRLISTGAVTINEAYTLPATDGTVGQRLRTNGSGTLAWANEGEPSNTPAQIVANVNDYAPGAGSFQRWSSDASRNVTGMVAGASGERRDIWNIGGFNIVLKNADGSSSAVNQWLTSTAGDITLQPKQHVTAQYDSVDTRWRVTAAS